MHFVFNFFFFFVGLLEILSVGLNSGNVFLMGELLMITNNIFLDGKQLKKTI